MPGESMENGESKEHQTLYIRNTIRNIFLCLNQFCHDLVADLDKRMNQGLIGFQSVRSHNQ